GVIAVEGEVVRFRHPLYGSAVLATCSLEEKRSTHRRLAATTADVEQRARHLALSTDEPEEEVARTVTDAAGVARRRGAPEAAAKGDSSMEATCHGELAVYCEFDVSRSERHAKAAVELLTAELDAADLDTLTDALIASARASLLLGRGLPMDVVERAFESVAG